MLAAGEVHKPGACWMPTARPDRRLLHPLVPAGFQGAGPGCGISTGRSISQKHGDARHQEGHTHHGNREKTRLAIIHTNYDLSPWSTLEIELYGCQIKRYMVAYPKIKFEYVSLYLLPKKASL